HQVMRTRFWSMAPDATVQEAIDDLLAGGDSVLIVVENGRYKGLLQRDDLMQAVAQGKAASRLNEFDLQHVPPAAPGDGAHASYQRMLMGNHPVLPVVENE